MEDSAPETIHFLKKPEMNYEKLNYIKEKKEIYVNLFEFSTVGDLKVYKYPLIIKPEIEKNAIHLSQKILNQVYKQINSKYGVFTISGDSLYAMKKVEDILGN